MKSILITGGSGFLGIHLANKLKKKFKIILAGRNNKQNFYAQKKTTCEVLPMDVANIESVRDAINYAKPNIIIHAAATKFVDLSEKYPLECIDINILDQQILLGLL
jgi:UDP-glucose 4-epimerase